VVNLFNLVEVDEEIAQKHMRSILLTIASLDPLRSPTENVTVILHKANELLGVKDPYCRVKHESNILALGMLPKLRETVNFSNDPLNTACKLAIAGNIIDMILQQDFDINASVEEALSSDFPGKDYEVFKKQVEYARQILIIGDNSGEIAFDRLLVEQLKRSCNKIIYAVKGGPIINDATMQDAEQVGMVEEVELITNGNNSVGTNLERCSSEFRQAMAESDVIISKGQANYESLESTLEAGDKTFFLLRAKCPAIAQKLGVKLNGMVLRWNGSITKGHG
jgi:uncharacterized protein with ATP-grasp and redox domains